LKLAPLFEANGVVRNFECERHSDVEVVGEAGSVEAAVSLAQQQKPDLIVIDPLLPGLGHAGDAARIVAQCAELSRAMLTVARGGTYIDPSLLSATLVRKIPSTELGAATMRLSGREDQVLRLVATVTQRRKSPLRSA
jgi:DNA-binding NarL/FixJ family response regulator